MIMYGGAILPTKTEDYTKQMADIWDVIICPNNHPCFLVVKPVFLGDQISKKNFMAIGKQKPINDGDLVDRTICWDCKQPVFAPEGWPDHKNSYFKIRIQGKDEETHR